ncbi:hypothetical protein IV203_013365 [Nitzschia inconspicua]|uniref:Uncharacterized protein n=1 Tax=Nitzschia inconspicua TaxID=303405 RepID=A0A9K3M5S8_9STRA|nr:hypothetical protein IV203_013365 [Nitzschia inconspicua]
MSKEPSKQDDLKKQCNSFVLEMQAIIDNPSFSESRKRDLLRDAMQKQLEKGDHSFINPNSPFSKSFINGVALIDKYAATPNKPSMQREHCHDFVAKKIDTLLPVHMELPPIPKGSVKGARKLECPRCTLPAPQSEVNNNLSTQDTNNAALAVEKCNGPTAAHPTTVCNSDYFCQEVQEWVPKNVAEALYLMGPTAESKRSRTHKNRTRDGYKSKLFHCSITGCSMRWLIQARDWNESCPSVFVQPSQE